MTRVFDPAATCASRAACRRADTADSLTGRLARAARQAAPSPAKTPSARPAACTDITSKPILQSADYTYAPAPMASSDSTDGTRPAYSARGTS